MGRKRLRDEIVMWKAIDLAWKTVLDALQSNRIDIEQKINLAAQICRSTVPKNQEVTAGTTIQINVVMPELPAPAEAISEGGMIVELPSHDTTGKSLGAANG